MSPIIIRPRFLGTGATLIEYLVLTILLLIFITLTIERIWALRVTAERIGIEQMVGSLKSALGIELAASVIKRDTQQDLARYNHSNPMKLLEAVPDNYLGEFATAPDQPKPGFWYFNRREGTLNYRIHFREYLVSSNHHDPDLIRFQIQFNYRDSNHNGLYDQAIDTIASLSLLSLDSYHWTADAGR